jgi:hypothetical protein
MKENNWHSNHKEAERLLQEERYSLCTLQCGRIIELLLKDVLREYMGNSNNPQLEVIKKHLALLKRKYIDLLTLGEIINLLEKSNLLDAVFKYSIELRLIDFQAIKSIRNQAAHGEDKANDLEKADAHLMYSALVRLIKIAEFLPKREEGDSKVKYVHEKNTPIGLTAKPVQSLNPLTEKGL